jgi:hypothetical protein
VNRQHTSAFKLAPDEQSRLHSRIAPLALC